MTTVNSKNTKPLTLILLVVLLFILGVFYMLSNYNKPKPIVNNTNNNQQQNSNELQSIITGQNEYINYKYNFGLSFPDYWKGFNFEESNNGINFSLKNKKGEYFSIFSVKVYTSAELGGQVENNTPIYVTSKNNLYFAYFMERNDQNLSELGDVFASNSYSGLLFDVQNNIISTFKFIKKGEVFNEKNKFQKDNEFKLAKVKVGDIIAGMTVKFIRSFDGYDIPPNYLSVDDLSIGFFGETTITGTYHNDKVDLATGFGGTVCFDSLDEQSKKKIPSVVWNNEYISFCFSNQDLAREIFKPEGSV